MHCVSARFVGFVGILRILTACCVLICSSNREAYGAAFTWNNTGTDFNAAASWTEAGGPPGTVGTGDTALFPNVPGTNPNLSASPAPFTALRFTSTTPGYTLSGDAGTVLTVIGTGTSASASLFGANTSGTNTISANVVLGAAAGLEQSIGSASGGNLTISGNISSTNTLLVFNLTGSSGSAPGAVTLTGNNTWSATTTDIETGTVNVGSNTALSSGAVNTAQSASKIDAVGGDRVLSNSLTLGSGNTLTFIGTNNLAFGAFTINDSNSKTFNNSSTTGKTLSLSSASNNTDTNRTITLNASSNGRYSLGSLALAASGATGTRTLSIAGTGAADITGAVTNGGGTFNQNLTYSGTGTLNLIGTGSTYSGATVVSAAGTLVGIGANAFGSTTGVSLAGTSTLSLRGDASTSFVKASDSSSYTVIPTGNGSTINVDRATVAGTGAKTMTIGAISPSSVAATFQVNFTGANNTGLTVGAVTGPASSAAATVTLNNTNTSGTTTFASFTSGNTIGGATLVITGTGNTTITGAISPSSTALAVTKTGSGKATFGGTNTYTGITTVSGGTLVVNGSIASSSQTNVNSTATLMGTGTVGATTVAANATLAPGASIGTLTFSGNLTLEGDLDIDYDGTGVGSIDLVDATGQTLDITAGSLTFLPENANPLTGPAYVFANYGTLVGSAFASVTSLPLGYSIDYAYNGGTAIALVSAVIPEASSFLLVGLVGVGSLLVRRLRRVKAA